MGLSITVAGGPAIKPVLPKLSPAWPAPSPWVTTIGATRFIDQNASKGGMASTQFGFSHMFPSFPDQQADVHRYLQSASHLPPNGSSPIYGKATPDVQVAALGQGYQYVAVGRNAGVCTCICRAGDSVERSSSRQAKIRVGIWMHKRVGRNHW